MQGTSSPVDSMPAVSSSSVSSAPSAFRTDSVELIAPDGHAFSLIVELATTPEEQAQGLMFREHLADDAGMLFIFSEPKVLSFWMKNTLLPLDIIFFDADGKFVSSATMTPCTEEPCQTYPSAGEAAYALEVNVGYVEKNSVGPGWMLTK